METQYYAIQQTEAYNFQSCLAHPLMKQDLFSGATEQHNRMLNTTYPYCCCWLAEV